MLFRPSRQASTAPRWAVIPAELECDIARFLDACKWTWTDYKEVLRGADFTDLFNVKEKGMGRKPYILNVAVK